MSSVGSREHPIRKYSRTTSNDDQFDYPTTELNPLHPRRPSSYEEMSGSDGYTPDGNHHQYEDPRLLARQIRNGPPPCKSEITVKPRKKTNELYERCRSDSDGSQNPGKRMCCRDAMCFLVSLSFVFAVGALALVILVILGHLVTAKCGKCLDEVHPKGPVSGASTNARDEGMLKMIKELQGNLTFLRKLTKHQEFTIKELQDTDQSHSRKLDELSYRPRPTSIYIRNTKYNASKLRGAQGPRGLPGKQGLPGVNGKPGSGNISKCVYKTENSKYSASPASGHNVYALQPKGWVIISATCSSDGAAESNLDRYDLRSGIQFTCKCRGISVAPSVRGSATCYIHYWQCPIV